MFRIKKPRGLTNTSLFIAITLGFVSGIYIYRPLLVKYKNDLSKSKESTQNVSGIFC